MGDREGRRFGENAYPGNITADIVGPCTKATETERGNGLQLQRVCQRQRTVPIATWAKPRLGRNDKWETQNKLYETKTARGKRWGTNTQQDGRARAEKYKDK